MAGNRMHVIATEMSRRACTDDILYLYDAGHCHVDDGHYGRIVPAGLHRY